MKLQVTIDCADPAALAEFWAAALEGYVVQPPPSGFESWPAALAAWAVPDSEWTSASAVVDETDARPRLFFQRVPEAKAVKNRLHLDVSVSDGPQIGVEKKRAQIAPAVERLTSLGATVVGEVEDLGSVWTVMQDPQGNEFCVT